MHSGTFNLTKGKAFPWGGGAVVNAVMNLRVP